MAQLCQLLCLDIALRLREYPSKEEYFQLQPWILPLIPGGMQWKFSSKGIQIWEWQNIFAKYYCHQTPTPRETAGELQLYLNALEQLGYFSGIHKRLHSLECKITRRNALYQANYLGHTREACKTPIRKRLYIPSSRPNRSWEGR